MAISTKFAATENLHILLIGFMGVGKSTVGRLLAQKLKRRWIDTDLILQERTGLVPASYIRRFGLEKFRAIEWRLLFQTLDGKPAVVTPGGGAVLNPKNRWKIRNRSKLIWLKVSFSILQRRLKRDGTRLLFGQGLSSIQKLYHEREPLYRRLAHHEIDVSGKRAKEICNEILDVLGN